jgi:hypothetical protein
LLFLFFVLFFIVAGVACAVAMVRQWTMAMAILNTKHFTGRKLELVAN